MTTIKSSEVVELLHRVLANPSAARFEGTLGDMTSVDLYFDGWRVNFFDDAGELDYVDWVQSPDGRRGEYEDFSAEDPEGWKDPLDSLGIEGSRKLESMWPNATRASR